ncbi:GGDEF domain-containing protein [Eggerthella sinensis]|uniref:GGDEF domain-containing protein n=1 Tax=Eggerthella sinensis TaxID=242230 RepID=A0A3N0IX72_9ACTN|nr:GGDEF domain-containing protein [Eggerthella sinensis]RNM41594.1 GGDEF domain-containing protein [Eggerthella sinensis]
MANEAITAFHRSRFSFKRLAWCGVLLAALSVLAVCAIGVALAVHDMRHETTVSLTSARPQIEQRIDESFKLLESLAVQPVLCDPDVPVMDKVSLLDQVNERYQYFLLCYVDEDINVWDATGPASLASRDFMQKLYATGERTVTDSFAAGADGVTLNYVVLVPLHDEGVMTGSLFVSLYFDDVDELLNESTASAEVESVLVGSRGQVMSATSGYVYDDFFLDPLRDRIAFGVTADGIEAELLASNEVDFWTVEGLDLRYYVAAPIDGTSWDLVCSSDFWSAYAKIMSNLLPVIFVILALIAGMFALMWRWFSQQMESASALEKSVEQLQKKLYSDDGASDADISDILELTSSGLSDGLTGTFTRSVFASRLTSALEHAGSTEKLYALCFVDVDDFKLINDTYGHAMGDVALKSIGYLLREFERRYDGLVGRYGGDEFVLLMTDLDNDDELRDVLDEMTAGLHVDIQSGDAAFSVHCSVGVSVWDGRIDADVLMEQADQALYIVKQQGKENYCVYQDRDAS